MPQNTNYSETKQKLCLPVDFSRFRDNVDILVIERFLLNRDCHVVVHVVDIFSDFSEDVVDIVVRVGWGDVGFEGRAGDGETRIDAGVFGVVFMNVTLE